MLARADAMFSRHESTKRADSAAPPPPKPPRQFRISEAKQGAQWVAELTSDQRVAAGVADDWYEQAVADINALGGIPPAPPKRIGRPRKPYAPIEAPAGLITELPGEVETFDPFTPTMPTQRPRAAETAPSAKVTAPRAVQLAFPFVALLVTDAGRPAQRAPANVPRRPRNGAESSRLSRAGPGLRPIRPGTITRTHGGLP